MVCQGCGRGELGYHYPWCQQLNPQPLKEAVKPEPQLAQRADEIASNAARRVACQMYDYEGRKATIKAALTEYAHALKER